MVKKEILALAVLALLVVKTLAGSYSQCEYERAVGMAHMRCGMVGNSIPTCEKDGSYSIVQCSGSTGSCWCVDPYTGKKVEGDPRQCIKHETTECEMERDVAIIKQNCGMIGVFIPKCQEDGSFAHKQCWASTGQCWCVNTTTGKPTSRPTRKELECPEIIKPACRISFVPPAPVLVHSNEYGFLSAKEYDLYFQDEDSMKAYMFRFKNSTLFPQIGVCLLATVTFPEQKLSLAPVEYCSGKLGVRVVPGLRYNPKSKRIDDVVTGMCLGMTSLNHAAILSESSCHNNATFILLSPIN